MGLVPEGLWDGSAPGPGVGREEHGTALVNALLAPARCVISVGNFSERLAVKLQNGSRITELIFQLFFLFFFPLWLLDELGSAGFHLKPSQMCAAARQKPSPPEPRFPFEGSCTLFPPVLAPSRSMKHAACFNAGAVTCSAQRLRTHFFT